MQSEVIILTRKEKVREMEPEAINNCCAGGVEGCPHYYPFLGIVGEKGKCLIDKPVHSFAELSVKCEEYWNTVLFIPLCCRQCCWFINCST